MTTLTGDVLTMYLAAVCGLAVHAFEPNPRSFAALVANVASALTSAITRDPVRPPSRLDR